MQSSKENSRLRTILLHRELLNPGPGMRRRTPDAKLLHLCYKKRNGPVTAVLLGRVAMLYRFANERARPLGYWIPLLRTITSSVFDAPDERVIAQGRFVLCLISLLAVHFDPTQPAQYATAATPILTAYTVLSAGLVALTYYRLLTPRTQYLIHIANVIIVSLLLFLTKGLSSVGNGKKSLPQEDSNALIGRSGVTLLSVTLRWEIAWMPGLPQQARLEHRVRARWPRAMPLSGHLGQTLKSGWR